ncbi:hypothetical protein GALMADRAFT_786217 [Galerina marginata CBS 339.88]|uniref:Uncharacterized protein n=1 Tax=Galerina marginata (strain CBS 339.88) TaxID=685588 RepID=A0A067SXE4_GALM3|nr:hypothetical protein GALMADRAFT_786217 [Galerina marginata CBS 339.88]
MTAMNRYRASSSTFSVNLALGRRLPLKAQLSHKSQAQTEREDDVESSIPPSLLVFPPPHPAPSSLSLPRLDYRSNRLPPPLFGARPAAHRPPVRPGTEICGPRSCGSRCRRSTGLKL